MVTRNFKSIAAMLLGAAPSAYGSLPLTNIYGVPGCTIGTFASGVFPATKSNSMAQNATSAGIVIGTGSTPASEDDYKLEAPITSGVTASVAAATPGVEPTGIPYLEYTITVTNTGSSELTIREIGYQQTVNTQKPTGTSTAPSSIHLLDRTVLSAPLTIQAGDAGIIRYRLRTRPEAERTVAGVPMVSWTWGTDEQLAAMIDAAQAGTIDLQTDGGWRVGDLRKIHIDAWTGGNNVAHAAEDLCIVITSFDEYENSGNVLQFDFFDCCSGAQRMNSSNTTAGGYGSTEMYNTTLPALAEALPSWIKNRLRTFSVQASNGGSDIGTAGTVTGNKLALRSAMEVFGRSPSNVAPEGTQIDYYKRSGLTKRKGTGFSGSSEAIWATRSPYNSVYFAVVSVPGELSYSPATTATNVAPFGCL